LHRIEADRDDRIRKRFGDIVRKLSLVQGNSKLPVKIYPVLILSSLHDSDKKIYIWVRDGWSSDENSVRADARLAGNQAPAGLYLFPGDQQMIYGAI
jgi:hypothetical protein